MRLRKTVFAWLAAWWRHTRTTVQPPAATPAKLNAPSASAAPDIPPADVAVLATQAKADTWYQRDVTAAELDDAARMKALDRDRRLPLDPTMYMNRSFCFLGSFVPLPSGMAGVRSRPAPLTAARLAAPGATEEVREKFRLEIWALEERRREAEVAVVERQNELVRGRSPLLEQVDQVEFWFTRDDKVFFLRAGQDSEHSRRLDALTAADADVAALKQRFREQYGAK